MHYASLKVLTFCSLIFFHGSIFGYSISIEKGQIEPDTTVSIQKKSPVYLGIIMGVHYNPCINYIAGAAFVSWKRTTIYGGPHPFDHCSRFMKNLESDKYVRWEEGKNIGYNLGYMYAWFKKNKITLNADINLARFPVRRVTLPGPGYAQNISLNNKYKVFWRGVWTINNTAIFSIKHNLLFSAGLGITLHNAILKGEKDIFPYAQIGFIYRIKVRK